MSLLSRLGLFGPPNVEKLEDAGDVRGVIRALRHRDPEIRRDAVGALRRLRVGDPLGTAVLDADKDVAYEAVLAVRYLQLVAPLKLALTSPFETIRAEAVKGLGYLGTPECVEALLPAFEDQSELVRLFTIKASHESGDERVIPALVAASRDPDERLRDTAVQALGGFDDASALSGALRDRSSDVRCTAAQSLGLIGNDTAVTGLLFLLRGRDPYVSGEAASALGRIGNSRAIDAIVGRLAHRDKYPGDAFRPLLTALAQIGDARAIVAMQPLKLDRDDDVRMWAGEAIAVLSEPSASSPVQTRSAAGPAGPTREPSNRGATRARLTSQLRDAFRESNHGKAFETIQALRDLGDPDAVEVLISVLTARPRKSGDIQSVAALALGELGDQRAVPVLLEALWNGHDWFNGHHIPSSYSHARRGAAEALGRLGDVRAVDPLLEALHDPYFLSSRGTAAAALGRLGDVRAVDPIRRLLRDWSSEDSVTSDYVNAAEALGKLGDARPGIEDELLRGLRHWHKGRRKAAATALGQLGSDRSIGALKRASRDISDRSIWMREELSAALGQIMARQSQQGVNL